MQRFGSVTIGRFAQCVATLIYVREHPVTAPLLLATTFVAFWSATLHMLFALCAFFVIFKYVYIKFLRHDVPTALPLWKHLRFPAHGCHRGGGSHFGPENTLYNYIRCVSELKTEVLEMDLRLSKDGHVVLLHDKSVDRTTNGTGNVTSFTLQELKLLDAAWAYPELRGKGITIPTLSEVLHTFAIKYKDLVFFFDIKDKEVVKHLPEIINTWNLSERVMLGAVDPKINSEVLKILPQLPISPDAVTVLKYVLMYSLGLDWVIPTKHAIMGAPVIAMTHPCISKGMINSWTRRQLKVVLYGPLLDDPLYQKEYLEKGVHVLLTDRPDLLRNILGSVKISK